MPAPRGFLALILDAHLPFVRHPGSEARNEERWLFEALTTTFLPLLDLLETLRRETVPTPLSIAFSPPLIHMLSDPLLQVRYQRWLDSLLDHPEATTLSHERTTNRPENPLQDRRRLRRAREIWSQHNNGYLLGAFADLARDGLLELLASSATHAFLPLHSAHPEVIRAQIRLGIAEHERAFGERPLGFWLPECGYFPGLDDELRASGIKYTVVEPHAIEHSAPEMGVHAPIICPSGLVAFARDPGTTDDPHDGTAFVHNRARQISDLAARATQPPVVLACLRREEVAGSLGTGNDWLDCVFRASLGERDRFEMATLSRVASRLQVAQELLPLDSSRGASGDRSQWIGEANDWIYPHLDFAADRMHRLAAAFESPRGALLRALEQATRELLLAQASDWPLLMSRDETREYAEERFRTHTQRFHLLADQILAGAIDEATLRDIESADNIFPSIDFRLFQPQG